MWATLETWIVNSLSTMPPGSPMRGLVRRRAAWTRWTMSRASAGMTRSTSPRFPLSRPLMTTTLSPFLIFIFGIGLEDLGGEGDDLHKAPRPQFTGHRAEDAGPDRLALVADQDGGVAVKADGAAVGAADLFGGAHDDGAVNIALFHPAARDCLLDRDDDDVAHRRGGARSAAPPPCRPGPPRARN